MRGVAVASISSRTMLGMAKWRSVGALFVAFALVSCGAKAADQALAEVVGSAGSVTVQPWETHNNLVTGFADLDPNAQANTWAEVRWAETPTNELIAQTIEEAKAINTAGPAKHGSFVWTYFVESLSSDAEYVYFDVQFMEPTAAAALVAEVRELIAQESEWQRVELTARTRGSEKVSLNFVGEPRDVPQQLETFARLSEWGLGKPDWEISLQSGDQGAAFLAPATAFTPAEARNLAEIATRTPEITGVGSSGSTTAALTVQVEDPLTWMPQFVLENQEQLPAGPLEFRFHNGSVMLNGCKQRDGEPQALLVLQEEYERC